jgi:iron(III) transport system ATP-binding protein
MHELVVEGIHKRIGENEILKGISLTLKAGEVVALLGHSGSGKTTILRSVAGLETPDAGRITLKDRVVFDARKGIEVPSEKRGLGLVFQSYALWPNRTVNDNVAYALKLRRVATGEIKRKVDAVLERLGLGALGERYPHQLSGGQQQRVALARALVYQPQVLLLDEPLSNLDAKLREDARAWIRELILQTRISALYVTHDQVEAMAVADRVLLLRDGEVEQQGSPQEIYQQPRTALAAEFMGSNNHIAGVIGAVDGSHGRLDFQGGYLWGKRIDGARPGEKATGYVRVERMRIAEGPSENRIACTLETSLYLGERWEHRLALGELRLRAWGATALPPGPHWIEIPMDELWLF